MLSAQGEWKMCDPTEEIHESDHWTKPHQHFVDVEVGGVSGLVAPGGGVQSRADIQFVRERLAHAVPDPEKLSFRYRNVKIVGLI